MSVSVSILVTTDMKLYMVQIKTIMIMYIVKLQNNFLVTNTINMHVDTILHVKNYVHVVYVKESNMSYVLVNVHKVK